MSAVLINAWDPRHINVLLYEYRFRSHIATGHPGVDVESIRYVVEQPDIITSDENNDLVENYYKQGAILDAPRYFLKVCVRFDSDVGKVVTAFEVDRPKPAERIIWKP